MRPELHEPLTVGVTKHGRLRIVGGWQRQDLRHRVDKLRSRRAACCRPRGFAVREHPDISAAESESRIGRDRYTLTCEQPSSIQPCSIQAAEIADLPTFSRPSNHGV